MEELAAANDNLSSALSRLLMVVENYPEIQSSQGYISLMDELAGTENRISVARQRLQRRGQELQQQDHHLPEPPGRRHVRIREGLEYFTAPESAQSAPDVNFDA